MNGVPVKAAILAGGKGTRFKPYTDILAKSMMPIGEGERPLIEHVISWLSRHGVKDLILLIGHHGNQIINYFRDGDRWGVRIRYSEDDEGYTGTGGSLLRAYDRGLLKDYDTVLIWYGDILAKVNVRDLLEKHTQSKADATIVVATRYRLPVGVAELEGDNIVRLVEKPWYPVKATIGVLVLEARILGGISRVLGKQFDIMSDLIPYMIREGMRVKAYQYDGPWYDVGSMDRYAKLSPRKLREEFGDFIV